VLPYFWETWWFRTFLAAGTCLALVTVVVQALRRRHKLELERLERSHEMERERARIAQDLHDDLGTSLTQISLMSSLLDRENAAPAETRSLTREIRATSRTMVAALNEIVWAVNPKNDSLNELAGYLGNVAEAFFRSGAIRCRLDIPNDLPDHPLTSEVRHGLFLAFKEAINNVAKHSLATEIQVRIRCPESELQLAIQDDGTGFDPAAKRPGNGLMNMRQRLEKMGGTCEVRSAPGEAATILFRLKLPGRI
jgi:signal transduction histidine kinase